MARKGRASFKAAAAGGALGVTGKLLDAGARGTALAAELVLEESNRRVPFLEGVLEGSGTVVTDRKEARSAVTYDTPYALVQHEDTSLRHPKKGEAKFLENAVNGTRDGVRQVIAEVLRGAL